MKKIQLNTKLSEILSTTNERIKLLAEINIFTLKDLLEFFPRHYEKIATVDNIHDLRADQKNILKGTFSNLTSSYTRNRKLLLKAIFETEKGECVECVWFNQAYLKNTLPLKKKVIITSKAKMDFGKITLQNPIFEIADQQNIKLNTISPIYREHGKLSNLWFRKKISENLQIAEKFNNLLPLEIIEKEKLLEKNQAMQEIHFPSNEEKLEQAKKTLAFEELFLLQIAGLLRKRKWQKENQGKSKKIALDIDLQKKFFKSLPFTLTDGQKIALFEIISDFDKDVPSLRLLQGDVGSGKTVVALAASLPILQQKKQVAFLAPTEVLAHQHFISIQKLINNFDPQINVELLTGSIKGKKRQEILTNLRKGKINILLGTHAIIQENIIWHHLGFAIIDEQHRFGVKQREILLKQNSPHILQMTATPIPRSLAMVAFSDQDLSIITELPQGRKKIHTKVVPPLERKKIEEFIKAEINQGRQGFIICPLIEDSEKIAVKSAIEEFKRLKKDVFPNMRLELLHGKINALEKKIIMQNFLDKKFDLLVATSVVEVGIDIPNATVMLIEGAERFGLAQLHQFRGRVGRGKHQSYCFLFPSKEGSNKRLLSLEKYDNGFQLAEIDMRLRGCGEIFGLRQSGIPDLKIASLFDARVIDKARKSATNFMEKNDLNSFSTELKREILQREKKAQERI